MVVCNQFNYTCIASSFEIWQHLLRDDFFVTENKTIPVYVRGDDTLLLSCPGEKRNDYVSWFGPPNLLLYSQKKQVNNFLWKRNRVAVISLPSKGKYCLQIEKFSLKDKGVYRCTTINGNIPSEQYDYNVQLAGIHL